MQYHELALEILPAVKAASEGKGILFRKKGSDDPWVYKTAPGWDPYLLEYKVEEPSKLVPYSADKWHGITRVKDKKTGDSYAVGMVNVADGKVFIGGHGGYKYLSFEEAMERYTHINGDPLGKNSNG